MPSCKVYVAVSSFFTYNELGMTSSDDRHLVQLAQQGQADAVAALYQKYLEAIYRFFYWQTNQQSEIAQDLTQETFLEMAKSIGSFRARGNFRNWLYTIAKRRLSRWLKQKYDLPTVGIFESLQLPDESIDPTIQHSATQEVQAALAELTDVERAVVTLRLLRNYSTQETADELHLTPSNVKVILHRTLKKLRRYLERPQQKNV